MNRATLAALGLFTGCAAAALAIPSLPLRLAVPCLALIPAVLALGPRVEENLRSFVFLAVWLWALGCSLAAGPGSLRAAVFTLTAFGLSLGLPAAAAGLRQRRLFSLRLDAGVLGGCFLLAFLGSLLTFVWPQRIRVSLPALLTLLGALLLAWLAVRAIPTSLARSPLRRAAVAGLTLGAAALFVGLILLWSAAREARRREAGADVTAALSASMREVSRARALDMRGSLAGALRRQARLTVRAGDAAAAREMLREVADLDPADLETRQALFRFALDDRFGSLELLDEFGLLPDRMIEPAEARLLLPRALQSGNWEAFGRAWRLAGGQPPGQGLAAGDLADAGKSLYFRGDYRTAADLLQRAQREQRDWETARILVFALMKDGRATEARRVLEAADGSGHGTEKAWIAGLIDRAGTKNGPPDFPRRGGVLFEGVLQLEECRVAGSTAAPGGEFILAFTWEVRAPVDPEWRVFVHLRRLVYGGFFFQGDHELKDPVNPRGSLPCGSRVSYEVRVPVPRQAPPGEYAITMGLWDGRSNRRPAAVPPLPASLRIVEGDRVLVEPGLRLAAGR